MAGEKVTGFAEGTRVGQKVRPFIYGDRMLAVAEESISLTSAISEKKRESYLRKGSLSLKDFGGFFVDLRSKLKGPLAQLGKGVLTEIVLPVMFSRAIGLPEVPDNQADFVILLHDQNWHGAVLCGAVEEEPLQVAFFKAERDGDLLGKCRSTSGEEVLILDTSAMLRREGFLLLG